MGRPLRVACADTFYHVFSRGNERRPVFYDERDREHFVELIGLLSGRFEVEVWAYVLMPNHYHLVVRTLRANLSAAMQWLGLAYANWFNARHGRSGHLFQGRFKAFVVEDESYLRRLLLYLHRNPLRSGLVERLADYPWSSYRCLAYGRGCAEWFRPALALGLFGGSPRGFRRAVQEYSEEADALLENLWHGTLLGSEAGLRRLVERQRVEAHREKPQASALLRAAVGTGVADIAGRCAEALGISPDELAAFRRPRRHAARPMRDVLIYLIWRRGEARLSDIGAFFGIGDTAVHLACRRALAHLSRDRRLADHLRKAGAVTGII